MEAAAPAALRPLEAAVFAALRRERIAMGLAEQLDDGTCRAVADPAAGTVRSTDPLGHQTLCTPDEQGFIGAVQSPLGRRWTLENDPQGRLLGLTDPAGTRLGLVWDERGRPIAIDRRSGDAPGPAWQLDYDSADNLTAVRWPDGSQETLSYPDCKHLGEYTDRAGGRQRFEHDPQGRLIAVADANGAATRFDYGQWDRPRAVTYPDGRRETYDWRPSADEPTQARLAAIGDADGPFARIDYRDGHISRIAYRDGETIEYAHDADGRITSAAVDGRTISFSYDPDGRLQSETNASATIGYEYDANGSLIGIQGPTGRIGYARDADLDLVGITDWSGAETRIRHSPEQRQTDIGLPNGLTCRETRTAAGRPAGLLIVAGGRPVHRVRYGYDAEDRLTRVEETGRPPRRHDYDPRGWLAGTLVEGTDKDPRPRGEIDRYDAAGHRIQAGAARADCDAAGKVLASGGSRYGYDQRGRLTERRGPDGAWTYSWSDRGLLAEVRTPRHQTIRYGYDAFARRSHKQVTEADGRSVATHFLWAGEQLIAELEQGPDGSRRRDYLWHPGGQTLFAMRIDGALYYSHNDHLGCPRRISDSQGRIAWAADAQPWGQAIILHEHIRQPWRLPGQYYDPETGLHYNRFRYYDPGLGRYVSPDLIGLAGGLDLYAYAGNDPVNGRDPLGLWSLGGLAKAAASVVVGVVVGVAAAAALVVATPVSLPVALAAAAAAGLTAGLLTNGAIDADGFCLPCAQNDATKRINSNLLALLESTPDEPERSPIVTEPAATVTEGHGPVGPGHYAARKEAREFGFAIRHPIAAADIGLFRSGSLNITTRAVRFSTNDLGLEERDSREGSQVNSFRHTLWQAQITAKHGRQIAHEAGNAHEANPFAVNGSNRQITNFPSSAEADGYADLRNNEIGRAIGSENGESNMQELSLKVLSQFHEDGLWVAEQQEDGTWSAVQRPLSDERYETANQRLQELNENGWDPEQQADRD